MIQRDIDRQLIEIKTREFLESGGVIEKLANWVGENGYKTPLNRTQLAKEQAKKNSGANGGRPPKHSGRWHVNTQAGTRGI
jgi:hypothetical protein